MDVDAISALLANEHPQVGALILSVADWPWLFAVNIPVGIAAIVLAIRTLPTTPRDSRLAGLLA